MALIFKGLQKTTLIDFPGQVACTFFLPKCNFRCGYCYNTALVLEEETGVSITEKEAFDFLEQRKNFLDGVCITGGEPTLHKELPKFCAKLKQKGLLVKIDTNGSNPKMLQELIEKKLVDFIAMDIKGPLQKYEKICRSKIDLEKIKKSAEIIMEAGRKGIDYEFRTTMVPELDENDLLEIAKWLVGSKKFVLQQLKNNVPLLDKKLEKTAPYSAEELKKIAEKIKKFFGKTEIRAG